MSGRVLKWLQNYLENRQQRVIIKSHSSKWRDIEAGVPQGSILGPLMFLIYINDIVYNINSSIKLFADDTTLYIAVETPQIASEILNSDLEKINNWSKQWLVDFNPAKTECLIFSNKLKAVSHPDLVFDNSPLKSVNIHKHLGLVFTSNGSWNNHVYNILEKA